MAYSPYRLVKRLTQWCYKTEQLAKKVFKNVFEHAVIHVHNEADGSSCSQISCKLAADTLMYTRTHDQMHDPFLAYTAGRKQKYCLHKFYIKYNDTLHFALYTVWWIKLYDSFKSLLICTESSNYG